MTNITHPLIKTNILNLYLRRRDAILFAELDTNPILCPLYGTITISTIIDDRKFYIHNYGLINYNYYISSWFDWSIPNE